MGHFCLPGSSNLIKCGSTRIRIRIRNPDLQALLPLGSRQQRLEGPAQPIQVPQADPSLVLQIIASLVIAVVGREVGAVER